MNPLFAFHELNDLGKGRANQIASEFDDLLAKLTFLCGDPELQASPISREFSIVKTKLEEACFFAKKAMAVNKGCQK